MKERDLTLFFNPKSIALIGASQNKEKIGGILVDKLKDFEGKVVFVNPKYKEIQGQECYDSVKKYKRKIDLAVIVIPSKIVLRVLKECGKKGIRNVIIISSGFSEQGNFRLEKKLFKIASKYSMNILGPNCFGIANPYLNLDTTFSNFSPNKGDVAFISQSGALASYIFDLPKNKIAGFVSLGNARDLSFSDWIKYFSENKNVKRIVLYIERIKNGREFIEVCKNCSKEIVVIKGGRTRLSSEATISHTGSLATEDEIYRGAFKQAGIKLIDLNLDGFENLKDKNVVVVTNAGGAGVILSDLLVSKGANVLEKPIDVLGDATSLEYKSVFKKIAKRNNIDYVVVILTPQKMSEPEKTAKEIVNLSKDKKVIAFFLGDKSLKEANNILKKSRIKTINSFKEINRVFEK